MSEQIIRYTLHERVMHWTAGFTYLYLLAGGLAFYAPQLFWIATILGGGATARFWHPWAGLIFAAVMVWMDITWRRDMQITSEDRRWMKEVSKYIENKDDEVPAAGRFNAGQKEFYWVMLVGTIGLLLSGLLLWFPRVRAAKSDVGTPPGDYRARSLGPDYDRRVHHSCLHGTFHGARRIYGDCAWKRPGAMGA